MLLGTDVDIETCKAEGYTIIEYNEDTPFTKDLYIRVFAYWPDYINEDVKQNSQYVFDNEYTFNDLVEMYEENKESIDSMTGNHNNDYYDFENPTYRDFLSLADDINSYSGL